MAGGDRPNLSRRSLIALLREDGWTLERIARHLGITKQGVHSALKSLRRGQATCCHCKETFIAPEGTATTRNVYCPSCLDVLPDIPFGRRIASLRIIVGLTQKKLAARLGVTDTVICS